MLKLFHKKEKIILRSEQQREDFIAKLEKANVHYDIREDRDASYGDSITYVVRIDAEDLKKVV